MRAHPDKTLVDTRDDDRKCDTAPDVSLRAERRRGGSAAA